MNKLAKEKRDQLIVVSIVTVLVVFALWYLVIGMQSANLGDVRKRTVELQKKISDARDLAKKGARYEAELQEVQDKLSAIEAKMLPVGNEYIKMLTTLNQAVRTTKVDFLGELPQPIIGNVEDLFPDFPYKAAIFADTSFYGYYHDFGKFLAEMENNFPYLRLQVASVRHLDVAKAEDPEKLHFKVKIVALVQPTPQR